jgi:hypothetical protein
MTTSTHFIILAFSHHVIVLLLSCDHHENLRDHNGAMFGGAKIFKKYDGV